MVCQEETPKDFYKKNDGGIRLTLKITPILTETVSLWLERVEKVVGRVKAILLDDGSLDEQHTTRFVSDEEIRD